MAEHPIFTILDQDIPEAQQNLRDSHGNLEKVAQYCRQNYLQADDKKLALEETKNYATQALASVAYQINAFSYHLMQLFDHQEVQVSEMQGQVRHINQTVMIHKEKIARREIGALATTNKSMHRQVKVLQPPNAERAIRYTRRPVDYTMYDDLGHGMKITQPQHSRNARKSSSSVTDGTGSISSATGAGALNATYDTGAIYRKTGNLNPSMTGTLTRNQGRNLGDYRTPVPPPPPVVPPIAPSNQYGPGHLSNGRQIQTGAATASPRLNGQGRGDHYRTGNMVQTSLPGYPLSSNVPINHHPHHNTIGALSPPIYNAVPQHSPLPPPNTQYASRNEIFQYPTNSQPTRRLSNGSGGGTYGALPSNGTYLAQPSLHQHVISGAVPPPPPPPGPGEQFIRNGSGNGYPMGANGMKTPLRNSTMTVRSISQVGTVSSSPLPPPPPETLHHNGNGFIDDGEPSAIPKVYLDKVVAIYDYQADKDDELSFMENQVIYVIKKNDDGWYEGVMDGVRGLFPGNYVEACI